MIGKIALTVIIVSIIALFIISILILIGLTHKNKPQRIKLPVGKGTFNKQCSTEKVTCKTNLDCQENCIESSEGEEYTCQDLPRSTPSQQNLYGPTGKFCLPAKAKMACNIAHGGIPIFTGWSNPERMEFDCLCSYPAFASSQATDVLGNPVGDMCTLNSGVCEGGVFSWDLTKKIQEPSASLCSCPVGTTLMVDNPNGGIPRCVPSGISNFYTDLYNFT